MIAQTRAEVDRGVNPFYGATLEEAEASAVGGNENRASAKVRSEYVTQVLAVRLVTREETTVLILNLQYTINSEICLFMSA